MTGAQDLESQARRRDASDPLAAYRKRFLIGDPDLVYLLGNSLGRLPRQTVTRMRTAVEQEWGRDLIGGWKGGWLDAPTRLGDQLGRLLGAAAGQVVVCDSTSVNLYKATMAALALRPHRHEIVSDVHNFPSDLYVLQGCIAALGGRHRLRLAPSENGIRVEPEALATAIGEHTALVTLSHVAYKSGYLHDAEAITDLAHQAGALVLWDLSHSAGVIPIDLDRWGVDLAVGCTYKYLNGGPGSPAMLYVRRGLQAEAQPPLWGWIGHRSPFEFQPDYEPADGIRRFQVGTPTILSLLALEQSLEMVLEAGMDAVHRKSQALSTYLVDLFDAHLQPLGFELGSPREQDRRGSHISIRHPDGYRITRALAEELKVQTDFREPDTIRLGLAPLYTSFHEIWTAAEGLRQVVKEGRYHRYSAVRDRVT